jgi:hypothetical protein
MELIKFYDPIQSVGYGMHSEKLTIKVSPLWFNIQLEEEGENEELEKIKDKYYQMKKEFPDLKVYESDFVDNDCKAEGTKFRSSAAKYHLHNIHAEPRRCYDDKLDLVVYTSTTLKDGTVLYSDEVSYFASGKSENTFVFNDGWENLFRHNGFGEEVIRHIEKKYID